MKLTKSKLKQIIKEELAQVLGEDSSGWTAEKWAELLNSILQQNNLTTEATASPNNVARVSTNLAKSNITPDHFKQSVMGSKYLDRTTLHKAGWPHHGGGSRDVATVVANVLMGPK
tara:strand:+ start:114 stop:461 length:348 start_codon:yes stop_codon:yes gene_type:complete